MVMDAGKISNNDDLLITNLNIGTKRIDITGDAARPEIVDKYLNELKKHEKVLGKVNLSSIGQNREGRHDFRIEAQRISL